MTARLPLRVRGLAFAGLAYIAATASIAGFASAQSENVTLLGRWDQVSSYSDVWGYSAPNGTELAILGLGNGGVSFINVTNPASPVEVFRAPGGTTVWRDMKTYGTYAYCVDDQAGNGLIVVDLSNPLAPVEVRRRTTEFTTAHNVWIDQEYGLLFACGASGGGDNMYIYDLTQDPSNPQYIYNFENFYIHDLYTKDGVAYLAAIFDGQLYTADITNLPASMPVLGSIVTDDAFTHNVWTTEDGRYAITTDEVGGGHLTIVDVSDPTNLVKVSEYNHPTNPSAIVHNVHVDGDYAHVAWYTNGYEVVDVSSPAFPERVGFYDTFPGGSANYDGAWGVYPYADNGLVYVSDISTGLYVLEFVPSIGRVRGVLSDAVNGHPVAGATVSIPSEGLTRSSDADGVYKFNLDPGVYEIEVTAFGYEPTSFNVNVVQGQTTEADRALDRVPSAPLFGVVSIGDLSGPAAGARVRLPGTPYETFTDAAGYYSFDFIPVGDYSIRAGLFGFGGVESGLTIVAGGPIQKHLVLVPTAFVDLMETNAGWTFSGTGSTGAWVHGNPIGTGGGSVQPEDDHTPAPGVNCFVTGQGTVGGDIGENDIDGGTQILTSPNFDLSGLSDPFIRYHRWYCNNGNSAVDDVFTVQISSNGGTSWVTVETLAEARRFWEEVEFRVSDFVTPTNNVRVRFTAADLGDGSIVEAAIDDLEIFGDGDITDNPDLALPNRTSLLGAAPNPVSTSLGTKIRFQLAAAAPVSLDIVDVQGRRVATLLAAPLAAGVHTAVWDGRDHAGRPVSAGLYFQRLQAGDVVESGRLVVLK